MVGSNFISLAISALSGAAISLAVGFVLFGRSLETLDVLVGDMAVVKSTLRAFQQFEDTAEAIRARAVDLESESLRLEAAIGAASTLADNSEEQIENLTADFKFRLEDGRSQLARLRTVAGQEEFATNPDFIKAIASFIDPLPADLVVASLTPCGNLQSGKWSRYEAASGRFILGESQQYPIGRPGGEAEVSLNNLQLPDHDHRFTNKFLAHAPGSNFQQSGIQGNHGNTGFVHFENRERTFNAGEGRPHNNMPPYVALYFCVKEG